MNEALPSIPADVQERLAKLSPEKRSLWEQLVRERVAKSQTSIARRGAVEAPLSFGQERLWFINQLEPDETTYHLHMHLPLPANLAVDRWKQSWARVVQRHEILRTRFVSIEGVPRQLILERLPVPIEEIDLRSLGFEERWDQARRVAVAQTTVPFDFTQPPLFRLCLLRFPDQYLCVMTFHHIIADGWSIDVLMTELNADYSSRVTGSPVSLPSLPVQYADFAVWQREYLSGRRLQPLLDFWTRTLEGMAPLLLPTDYPREAPSSTKAAAQSCVLGKDVRHQIRLHAQAASVTPFMWLLTAFCALLHRYTGQEDLAIGTPVAGREPAEVEPLIGFFLNTILLRIRISGELTFREALAAVKAVTVAAYSHQQLPFARIVEALQPRRDLRRNPLYQATFQLLSSQAGQARTDAVVPEIGHEERQLDVDFAFDVLDGSDELRCRVEYVRSLFKDESIATFLTHWQKIVMEFLRDPDVRIDRVNLLRNGERELLLSEWSGAREVAQLPPYRNLPELFDDIAHQRGEELAIIAPDKTLSYADLQQQSEILARQLRRRGVRPGDLVAIQVADSAETLRLILAAWKASAAYVYIDPESPAGYMEQILTTSAPALILSDQDPWWSTASTDHAAPPDGGAGADSEAIAAVIFTSGSTGTPKGVVLKHSSLLNQAHWLQSCLPLTADDRVLQKYSFAFDAALSEALSAWASGAPLVTTRWHGRDLDELIFLVRTHQVTVIDVVPSMLAAFLEHPEFPACRSLRRIICGGERLTGPLLERCQRVLPVEVLNLYGPAETTITATWHRCPAWSSPSDAPIGRPIFNTKAYVLDRHLEPCPVCIPGQLFIGGPGLARGYLANEEETNRRFIRHPSLPEANQRLYATGDRARFRPDGVLEYLGRLDQQVKLRGFRIELEEIEHALSQHPAVQEAAASVVNVPAVNPAAANLFLGYLESLSAAEAEFVVEWEKPDSLIRHQSMQHKSDQFDLYLHVTEPEFFQTLNEKQRHWWLRRTLEETAQNLLALQTVAERSVAGSDRPEMVGEWAGASAVYDENQLSIQGQQVMQRWELPLMTALADIASESHGDVVEVGFGMGISATLVQERSVRSHTIIENHPDVIDFFNKWRDRWPHSDIRFIGKKWQDWEGPPESCDAVLFDTYPTTEEEYTRDVLESPTFAASFFPTAARILRPGGVFTYYTNEIDSLGREHQRLLLRHFRSFSVLLVEGLNVPPDCQYWWADSMVVVRAVK